MNSLYPFIDDLTGALHGPFLHRPGASVKFPSIEVVPSSTIG